MMDSILTEFLVRVAMTAIIVIVVVELAARAGPAFGGIIAGLPIVLGPGYYFMLREQPPAYVADAVLLSLAALTATQIFLLTYVLAPARLSPLPTVALAAFLWIVTIMLLGTVEPSLLTGALSFVVVTPVAWLIGRGFLGPVAGLQGRRSYRLLLMRGIAAGILVGIVSLLSSEFGSRVSGALFAFPIGFATIGLSLHRDLGAITVARTAHASLLGMTSLAVFCIAMTLGVEPLGATAGFLLALVMSLGSATLGLVATRYLGAA